ncbi:hypothetical protein DP939_02310 [Spongiactinospora rosea]|uniref:Uncharacterized protein n=1 Tax=Spongiactinospora rosea TaxID=2248750 RepID=A0A366M7I7_9ACTN|nr:hypothetical protein [Spongiactinospora rosea]RBQ21564.1 hypothetical protein DP939_02310 [Spongiactinospora rosea]
MFRHRHRYTPIGVLHERAPFANATTLVLRRCSRCGAHDVETLPGRWDEALFVHGTAAPDPQGADHV